MGSGEKADGLQTGEGGVGVGALCYVCTVWGVPLLLSYPFPLVGVHIYIVWVEVGGCEICSACVGVFQIEMSGIESDLEETKFFEAAT